jgi:thioesterase domain-containing protein/acyl carrier protein
LGLDYAQNSGYYYYNPQQHSLIKVPVEITEIPNSGIYASFNLFYPAIYPYYHELSKIYSYLEAGYMSYLLEVNGITAKSAIINPAMATKAEEQILASYQLINHFPDKLTIPENTILLVNNFTTFSCYKFQHGKSEQIAQIDGSFKFGQKGSNLNILRNSAAVLLLSGDDYLAIGKWTQAFTEQALDYSFGSCLFGVFDLGKHIGSLLHQQHYNTAIVLGRITNEMIAAKSLDDVREMSSENSFIELIKEDLEEMLPTYMLPQHIIKLPEFPLTINGKVNLKALPVPYQIQEQCTIIQPRDKFENDFYQIWSQVLPNITKVGVENDFFIYGGDSLKAIMLSVKIGQAFLRKIPVTFVYKNRTISRQAKAIFEYLLQPTLDYVSLNSSTNNQVLILFPPINSGTEAYYALASQLENYIKVVGVNNYFINYPNKVSNDYNALIDYYTTQAKKILSEYSTANRVFLGGWSMGGNISISVYQNLCSDFVNLDQHVILFDSHNQLDQNKYISVKQELNDIYNMLNPQNSVYQQFVTAGYTEAQYKYFMDCSMEILNKMFFKNLSCRIFLIRCSEKISVLHCEDIKNNWGESCNDVVTTNVKANHINVLIETELISQVATVLIEKLFNKYLSYTNSTK